MEKLSFVSVHNGDIKSEISFALPFLSKIKIDKLISNKDIRLKGDKINKNCTILKGDQFDVFINLLEQYNKYFSIIYEDENVLIVNKNQNILSTSEGENVSSVESMLALKYEFVKAVHRLDRGTEGLLIFAKNKAVLDELINAIKTDKIEKKYLAQSKDNFKLTSDILNGYLVKDSDNSIVKVYKEKVPNSVLIETKYEVLSSENGKAIVEIMLTKGQTHQIRAHLSSIGCPIVGDGKYGKQENLKNFCLTAYKLSFNLNADSFLSYLNAFKFEISPTWMGQ